MDGQAPFFPFYCSVLIAAGLTDYKDQIMDPNVCFHSDHKAQSLFLVCVSRLWGAAARGRGPAVRGAFWAHVWEDVEVYVFGIKVLVIWRRGI